MKRSRLLSRIKSSIFSAIVLLAVPLLLSANQRQTIVAKPSNANYNYFYYMLSCTFPDAYGRDVHYYDTDLHKFERNQKIVKRLESLKSQFGDHMVKTLDVTGEDAKKVKERSGANTLVEKSDAAAWREYNKLIKRMTVRGYIVKFVDDFKFVE